MGLRRSARIANKTTESNCGWPERTQSRGRHLVQCDDFKMTRRGAIRSATELNIKTTIKKDKRVTKLRVSRNARARGAPIAIRMGVSDTPRRRVLGEKIVEVSSAGVVPQDVKMPKSSQGRRNVKRAKRSSSPAIMHTILTRSITSRSSGANKKIIKSLTKMNKADTKRAIRLCHKAMAKSGENQKCTSSGECTTGSDTVGTTVSGRLHNMTPGGDNMLTMNMKRKQQQPEVTEVYVELNENKKGSQKLLEATKTRNKNISKKYKLSITSKDRTIIKNKYEISAEINKTLLLLSEQSKDKSSNIASPTKNIRHVNNELGHSSMSHNKPCVRADTPNRKPHTPSKPSVKTLPDTVRRGPNTRVSKSLNPKKPNRTLQALTSAGSLLKSRKPCKTLQDVVRKTINTPISKSSHPIRTVHGSTSQRLPGSTRMFPNTPDRCSSYPINPIQALRSHVRRSSRQDSTERLHNLAQVENVLTACSYQKLNRAREYRRCQERQRVDGLITVPSMVSPPVKRIRHQTALNMSSTFTRDCYLANERFQTELQSESQPPETALRPLARGYLPAATVNERTRALRSYTERMRLATRVTSFQCPPLRLKYDRTGREYRYDLEPVAAFDLSGMKPVPGEPSADIREALPRDTMAEWIQLADDRQREYLERAKFENRRLGRLGVTMQKVTSSLIN